MTTTQTEQANGVRAGTLVLPHMLDWPAIRARLQEAMHRKTLSMRGLARDAHINHATLSKFLSGKSAELDMATLDAIAMALDVGVEALAGIEPAPDEGLAYTHDRLTPWLRNPRKEFDQAKIDELAASIREVGLLQPLLVDPRDAGKTIIIEGERRWRAIRKLIGEGHWPADKAIRCEPLGEADGHPLMVLALTANLQRQDLTALEEAEAFRILQTDIDMTPPEIGKAVGRSARHVEYRLKLLELGDAARAALIEGLIPASAARHIATLKDHKQQQGVVDRIREGVMGASETRVRAHVNMILSRPARDHEPDPEQMDIEDLAGAPADEGERDPEHPASNDRVYELSLGNPHYTSIRCKPLGDGGWTWKGNASLPDGGWGTGAAHDAEPEDSESAAVLAGALSTARSAANHLQSTAGSKRHKTMLRKVLAWANGLIETRGGKPVAMREAADAKADYPNPDFTPPPPEDRMRPHAERPHAGVVPLGEQPAAAEEKAYRLEFWSPEGPGGWPGSFQIRHRDKGLATYRLERVPQKD